MSELLQRSFQSCVYHFLKGCGYWEQADQAATPAPKNLGLAPLFSICLVHLQYLTVNICKPRWMAATSVNMRSLRKSEWWTSVQEGVWGEMWRSCAVSPLKVRNILTLCQGQEDSAPCRLLCHTPSPNMAGSQITYYPKAHFLFCCGLRGSREWLLVKHSQANSMAKGLDIHTFT